MRKSNKIFWIAIIALFVGAFIIFFTTRDVSTSDENNVSYFFARTNTIAKTKIMGDGDLTTIVKALPAFNRVQLNGHFAVTIAPNQQGNVEVKTDKNILPHLEIAVDKNTLKMMPKGPVTLAPSTAIAVNMASQPLHALALNGEGRIRAMDLNTDNLSMTLTGKNRGVFKGHVKQLTINLGGENTVEVTDLKGDAINLNIGGKGTVTLSGQANNLTITTAGQAIINAKDLIVNNVIIAGAGKTNATINARNKITITTLGDTNVDYLGDPTISKATFGKVELKRIMNKPVLNQK